MTDYGITDCAPAPDREQDPSSVKNLTLNWVKELAGETISTSAWSADGLTVGTDSNTDTSATVLLSGGAEGGRYEVYNTITTSGGQTLRKKSVVLVREQ